MEQSGILILYRIIIIPRE